MRSILETKRLSWGVEAQLARTLEGCYKEREDSRDNDNNNAGGGNGSRGSSDDNNPNGGSNPLLIGSG